MPRFYAPESFAKMPLMMLDGVPPEQMLEVMNEGGIRQQPLIKPTSIPSTSTDTFSNVFDSTGDPAAASSAAAMQSSKELESRMLRIVTENNRIKEAAREAELLAGAMPAEHRSDVFDVVSNNYGVSQSDIQNTEGSGFVPSWLKDNPPSSLSPTGMGGGITPLNSPGIPSPNSPPSFQPDETEVFGGGYMPPGGSIGSPLTGVSGPNIPPPPPSPVGPSDFPYAPFVPPGGQIAHPATGREITPSVQSPPTGLGLGPPPDTIYGREVETGPPSRWSPAHHGVTGPSEAHRTGPMMGLYAQLAELKERYEKATEGAETYVNDEWYAKQISSVIDQIASMETDNIVGASSPAGLSPQQGIMRGIQALGPVIDWVSRLQKSPGGLTFGVSGGADELSKSISDRINKDYGIRISGNSIIQGNAGRDFIASLNKERLKTPEVSALDKKLDPLNPQLLTPTEQDEWFQRGASQDRIANHQRAAIAAEAAEDQATEEPALTPTGPTLDTEEAPTPVPTTVVTPGMDFNQSMMASQNADAPLRKELFDNWAEGHEAFSAMSHQKRTGYYNHYDSLMSLLQTKVEHGSVDTVFGVMEADVSPETTWQYLEDIKNVSLNPDSDVTTAGMNLGHKKTLPQTQSYAVGIANMIWAGLVVKSFLDDTKAERPVRMLLRTGPNKRYNQILKAVKDKQIELFATQKQSEALYHVGKQQGLWE